MDFDELRKSVLYVTHPIIKDEIPSEVFSDDEENIKIVSLWSQINKMSASERSLLLTSYVGDISLHEFDNVQDGGLVQMAFHFDGEVVDVYIRGKSMGSFATVEELEVAFPWMIKNSAFKPYWPNMPDSKRLTAIQAKHKQESSNCACPGGCRSRNPGYAGTNNGGCAGTFVAFFIGVLLLAHTVISLI